MKTDWRTAFSYWFVHFCVEVICFYTVYKIFNAGEYWWTIGILYDTLAFAPQSVVGAFCEKYPKFRPGPAGGVLLLAGAAIMLAGAGIEGRTLYLAVELVGLLLLTVGNCLEHISGALVTLKVSEGRLAESAIFVGGGSFGVITGRLLSKCSGMAWIPFLLMILATVVTILTDRSLKKRYSDAAFEFKDHPCRHDIAADRPVWLIVLILGLVVVVRAYIGYGLPTSWNKTAVQTVCLFVFMGLGKMSGGLLSDLLGPRKVGILSCLLSVPLLLVSDNIMWLSLIAVALFSMTMAITLGGLVSVLPSNPGVAFGVTTIGLLLGTLPTFFWGMPERLVCNILIAVMSCLAAAGLYFSLKKDRRFREER